MSALVRPLEDEDFESVCTLIGEVFRFAYSHAYSDKREFEKYVRYSFQSGRCADDLHKDCIELLVAEIENKLAGVLKLAKTPVPKEIPRIRAVELAKLYVYENYHGTGLARLLLERGIESAERAGFDAIWLCVWEHNPRAQEFYKKNGFEAVGDIVIPMNDVPFRDLVMWKSIA